MYNLFLFFNIGGGEIFVIIIFILMFFGSKKIPDLARNLGKGMREIKNASDEIKREIHKSGEELKKEAGLDKDIDEFRKLGE
jgi:sec-independent protein translocase protein TatA